MKKILLIILSIILLGSVFLVMTSYQRKTEITGQFQHFDDNEEELILLVFENEKKFFASIPTGNNFYTTISEGHYDLSKKNHFVFYGDHKNDFESFTILNNQLDLNVTIDGQEYLFIIEEYSQ